MLLRHAGTRRRHDGYCVTYGAPVNGTLESAHHGGQSTNHYTAALQPSKPLLYEYRTHHDASIGAGFARITVNSTALFAIPLHVGK
jgi:hypothetical protein